MSDLSRRGFLGAAVAVGTSVAMAVGAGVATTDGPGLGSGGAVVQAITSAPTQTVATAAVNREILPCMW